MPKRTAKQLLYGLFYLACWAAVLSLVYFIWLRSPASCFDNKKNQDEADVDCGGASCIPCELKHIQPLQSDTVLALPIKGELTLVGRVVNPNPHYGADSFDFLFSVYGKDGKVLLNFSGKSFIYAQEFNYLIEPALPVAMDLSQIDHATLTLQNPEWKPSTDFAEPTLTIREQTTRAESQNAITSGVLVNNGTLKVSTVMIQALFKNKNGIVIGASQTIVKDVLPSENSRFEIHHPLLPEIDLGKTEIPAPKAMR